MSSAIAFSETVVAATTGPNPLWFVARATGVVALLLMTSAVVLGIVTSERWNSRLWPRSLLASTHRNLSLLSIVFLVVHITASILDPFAHIQWRDAVVPFGAAYRPIWLGLGVVAIELAIALIVTSLLRRFIGRLMWRAVHWAAYALWPLAIVHGLGTGSDNRAWWALAIEAGCVAAVIAALLYRTGVGRAGIVRRRFILVMTASGTAFLVGWSLQGPLQADWPLRAGTPLNVGSGATPPAQPKPTPLADAATGHLVGSGSTAALYLIDSRDPTIGVTVSPSPDGASRVLNVERNAQTVCSGTATIDATKITTTCGGVAVTVTMAQAADGSLSGTITTSKPLP